MKSCFLCRIDKSEYIAESDYAFARFDGYPVSEGHVLIISKNHTATFFDLPEVEQIDLMRLMNQTKEILDKKFGTTDYNVGLNCGVLAGQSIPHVHIHLIPRRKGDKEDPRGGVRWVIPETAKYWKD